MKISEVFGFIFLVFRVALAAVLGIIGFLGIVLVFGPILLILCAIPVLFLIALL
jgi:hypothetical protein